MTDKRDFTFINIYKQKIHTTVDKNQLAFTYCQVPVMYNLDDTDWQIEIQLNDGSNEEIKGRKINKKLSASIFKRNGNVRRINLRCPASELLF